MGADLVLRLPFFKFSGKEKRIGKAKKQEALALPAPLRSVDKDRSRHPFRHSR